MNVAFCIYDGMTALDFVGIYDPVTRLHRMGFLELNWDICARTQQVTANRLTFEVDQVDSPLARYDILIIPGGTRTRRLMDETQFIEWLKSAREDALLVSVCTGSLLLGAAGYLTGKQATTHPSQYEVLKQFATLSTDRIVHDGNVITGRGVTAGIDVGLYVVEELSDMETRETIATQMDYPYFS